MVKEFKCNKDMSYGLSVFREVQDGKETGAYIMGLYNSDGEGIPNFRGDEAVPESVDAKEKSELIRRFMNENPSIKTLTIEVKI